MHAQLRAYNACRSVLHGEISKCLATPKNTKDKITYNQPNRPNRQTPQTKHKALPKGQPGRRITPINTAAVHASAQQPTISTHTRLGHHQTFSANAARCEAQEQCEWANKWRSGGACGGGRSLSTTDPGAGAGCNCRSWCKEGPRAGAEALGKTITWNRPPREDWAPI